MQNLIIDYLQIIKYNDTNTFKNGKMYFMKILVMRKFFRLYQCQTS